MDTTSMESALSLGWNEWFQAALDRDADSKALPARVIGQGKGHYQIQPIASEAIEAVITSRFHKTIKEPSQYPTVGDWVAFAPGEDNRQGKIHRILDRKNFLQRQRSGAQKGVQLIAANVDHMLIVSSFNEDFDLKRIGRYVALGKEAGCPTYLIMTKADICEDREAYLEKLKAEYRDLEVFPTSSTDEESLIPLKRFFSPGMTTVLVGSSGVGKSTLTNYLLGFDSQKTQGLSAGSRGRHTTTSRDLRLTRWGGLVIDTPGMQEISVVDEQEELEEQFADIEETMLRCKFTNCQHKNEPGCAIIGDQKSGKLSRERWENYLDAMASVKRRTRRPR